MEKSTEEKFSLIAGALVNLIADIKSKPNDTRYASSIKEAERILKVTGIYENIYGKNK